VTYEEHHAVLVAYLKAKVEVGDWHAVADAAMDLRELEVKARNSILVESGDAGA
jgi:hypothetical protein